MPEEATTASIAHTDLVFRSTALEDEAVVLDVMGFEALSQLFELEIHFALATDVPLDAPTIAEIMRAPAAVACTVAETEARPWFGVVREIELVSVIRNHRVVYRAVLVPSLWYLTQTVRSRIFQDLSAPEILEKVLTGAGFAKGDHFEVALKAAYPQREHVVQYQESDFDFFCRLAEHEGIFFFFDHSSGSDYLVIADHNSAFRTSDLESVPYSAMAGARIGHEALLDVRRTYRTVPRQVVLRDSNWRTPQLALQANAEVSPEGIGIVSLYGDHFADASDGNRYAKIRAEERVLATHGHRGAGFAPSLRPGQKFALTGHPFDEIADVEFVVTASEQRFSRTGHEELDENGRFATELELLPASIAYRPPRATRKPRIFGLMHGRIDGEIEGSAASIDEEGRYRVLFPFDEEGTPGGRASRWIRRAQAYAGPGYGIHFPLHIGTEVLIAHLDGDPDRPIIVGAVPNPSTFSPVVRENATQSVVRTKGNIIEEYEDDAT